MASPPSYLLIVFDIDKTFSIHNARRKYISKTDYDLMMEEYTKEIFLDEELYEIKERRCFGAEFISGFIYFLVMDVKKKV